MSEIVIVQQDGVLVVRFTSPRIEFEMKIAQIGRELIGLADQANGKMLLNFSAVSFMSSAMIAKIVLLNKKCQTNKTNLKLCGLSPEIKGVFEIVRLDKLLKIYDTEADAMVAFQENI